MKSYRRTRLQQRAHIRALKLEVERAELDIQALAASHDRETNDLHRSIKDFRRMADEARILMEVVGEVLGPNFIGLPARKLICRLDSLKNPEFLLTTPGGATLIEKFTVKINSESPDGQVHIRMIADHGESAYGISAYAIRKQPLDRLANMITRELAMHILRGLKQLFENNPRR